MKNLLAVIPIVVLMAACKNNRSTDETKVLGASTAETAEYTEWKKQKDAAELEEFREWKADKEAKQETKDNTPKTTVIYVPQPAPAPVKTSPAVVTTTPEKEVKKKGWSAATKGAVIGGTAGTAAGVLIGKQNKVLGGVIGAVLGGSAGYAIGKGIDKKNGR